jgi:peptidyl-prolyl cis-trans isomerase A (cyclophilin A)
MKKLIGTLILFITFLSSCSNHKFTHPHIVMETALGDIELELYENKAPKTVQAFLSFVDSDYYRNSSFYRVLNDENQPSNAPKSELIQGGIWKSDYKKSQSAQRIPHESTNITGVHHTNGTISLARLEPGSGGTEFFICVGDQPGFDYGGENNPDKQGYAAFGKVVSGMDIVRRIYNQREDDQQFDPPVVIYKIKRRG